MYNLEKQSFQRSPGVRLILQPFLLVKILCFRSKLYYTWLLKKTVARQRGGKTTPLTPKWGILAAILPRCDISLRDMLNDVEFRGEHQRFFTQSSNIDRYRSELTALSVALPPPAIRSVRRRASGLFTHAIRTKADSSCLRPLNYTRLLLSCRSAGINAALALRRSFRL